jgi:anti-sigma regulatory factor (Ser/Thr protein kinase)
MEFSRRLPAIGASVPLGRRLLRAWLRQLSQPYDAETALLLTSELLTNAVVHAEGELIVEVSDEGGVLRVGVTDESPMKGPRLQAQDIYALDEHGRGLQLVAALSTRWGSHLLTSRHARRKVVWFELAPTPRKSIDLTEPRHSVGSRLPSGHDQRRGAREQAHPRD